MRTARHNPARHSTLIAPRIRVAVALLFLCIALMAGSTAFAEDDSPLSDLVTFDGQDYRVTAEDWVSLEPTSTANVRKIGYGKVTEVDIVTTSTGTYSNDAIASPHVLYPGIEAQRTFSFKSLARLVSDAMSTGRLSRGSSGSSSSIVVWGEAPGGIRTYTRVTDLGLRSCMTGGSFTACNVSR